MYDVHSIKFIHTPSLIRYFDYEHSWQISVSTPAHFIHGVLQEHVFNVLLRKYPG